MKPKSTQVQNLVAKHAAKFCRATVVPNRKLEAKASDVWPGEKKSSLYDRKF